MRKKKRKGKKYSLEIELEWFESKVEVVEQVSRTPQKLSSNSDSYSYFHLL